jgi:circadian clock protein KaiC
VYPRLVAASFRREGENTTISSGLPALDALLGGGLDRGTSTLFVGAAGTGKSSLAAQFAISAAGRGERSTMFLFDESLRAMLTRTRGLGFDVEGQIRDGMIDVQTVDPAELSPGEFIQRIRRAVEHDGARVIVIDSLNGYLNAMAEEHHVLIQMHELLAYLAQLGVVTLMINAQVGLIGHMTSTVDVSYLADTVILLRYFEAGGEVRQAISVLKKRTGYHERSIRELRISDKGLHIGDPLRGYRGILTGVPQEIDPQSARVPT